VAYGQDGKLHTPEEVQRFAQIWMGMIPSSVSNGGPDWNNDPSYDWAAQVKRAREAKHAQDR